MKINLYIFPTISALFLIGCGQSCENAKGDVISQCMGGQGAVAMQKCMEATKIANNACGRTDQTPLKVMEEAMQDANKQSKQEQKNYGLEKISINFVTGEPYSNVRKIMISEGWQPFHANDAQSCNEGDARCQGRPEMVTCAGTGMANCKFLWKKNTEIKAICTVGEGNPTFDAFCNP